MRKLPFISLLLALGLFVILFVGSCTGKKQSDAQYESDITEKPQAAFAIDTTVNALYVIEVWNTDKSSVNAVVAERKPLENIDLKKQLVLRARDGAEVVQITLWNSEPAANKYADSLKLRTDRKVRVSRVVNYGAKQPKLFILDTASSVQYSEFQMKRKSAMDTLSTIAKGMTTSMAQVQPTLDYIMTLNSADSLTISLFGIWNTKEGFEVFAKQKTWGDNPYWEPYAINDHHMFDVVLTKSK
jgi:hypothetical protein